MNRISATDEQHEELFRCVADFAVAIRRGDDWQDMLERSGNAGVVAGAVVLEIVKIMRYSPAPD
ncbi:MAG TPA: hypothetical protein PKC64_04820 [Sporomusa sphaeroides]|nr:hypothetical protein [Sporomusa sphaeroides]